MAAKGSFGRSLAVGAVLGLVVVALVAVGLYVFRGDELLGVSGSPSDLLVVLETTEADGAHVAGVILHIEVGEETCTVEVVDPLAQVTLPGTSYTALKDAYPFGGAGSVAEIWADEAGRETPSWVALPEAVWGEIVDAEGGVVLDVPNPVNVYADGEFVAIPAGAAQRLDSSAIRGLVADVAFNSEAGYADEMRIGIGSALSDVLRANWDAVADAVVEKRAKSNVSTTALGGLREQLRR
ncbi:MAG: hypothetical protein Q8K99_06995 [Actinomycetota bacterium]|nr:hypothetical protein [Actinomycetota bacterium]